MEHGTQIVPNHALRPRFTDLLWYLFLLLAFNCLFKVSGRFLSGNGQNDNSMIVLTMNQEVTITESFIPEFSISTFFADLGGSLGLWLGVGAVQLLISGLGLATEVCARLGFYRK